MIILKIPSDEMLAAIMEKVARSARASTVRAQEALQRMFDETKKKSEHKCDMSSKMLPTLCVIAGPNGSGKTTTTQQLLANKYAFKGKKK